MYDVTFNKKDGVLFVDAYDVITADEIKEHIRMLDGFQKHSSRLLILEDARTAKLNIELDDIPGIAAEFKKLVAKYDYIRHAVIHSVPSNEAYAMVYRFKAQAPNYSYEIFTTFKDAMSWLQMEG